MLRYINEYEANEIFNNMLDELYGEVTVMHYKMATSRALYMLDPVAHREEFLNWLDANDLTIDESEAHINEDEENDIDD